MYLVWSAVCHFKCLLGHHDGIWLDQNQLVYAAVIVSSIPAYTVVLYFFYICAYTDCKNWFRTRGALRCLLGIEMVAGVIEMIGAALFIGASATLNDSNVLVYGVCAGVFGVMAGVTNILSRSCCCAYNCFGFVKDNKTQRRMKKQVLV